MFRREFLGLGFKLAKWAVTIWAGTELGLFLAQRREQPAPRRVVMAAAPISFAVTLRPAALTWNGAEMDVYNRPPIPLADAGEGRSAGVPEALAIWCRWDGRRRGGEQRWLVSADVGMARVHRPPEYRHGSKAGGVPRHHRQCDRHPWTADALRFRHRVRPARVDRLTYPVCCWARRWQPGEHHRLSDPRLAILYIRPHGHSR